MKLTSVNIAKDKIEQNGLGDIVMDHLKQMVVVVGRNGSGKSRLLAKVRLAVGKQLTPNDERTLRKSIAEFETSIQHWASEKDRFKDNNYRIDLVSLVRDNEIRKIDENIKKLTRDVARFKVNLEDLFLTYEGDIYNRAAIEFVPKDLNLMDPKNLRQNEIEAAVDNLINVVGVGNLSNGALSFIQDLHSQYWAATHQNTQLTEDKIKKIKSSYDKLQSLVKELLGVEFGSDERGHATLFGFPIGGARLSDGQKIILQLAVALHAHDLKISESIIFLDEPENHLHPASIIDVIDRLKMVVSNGQIWLATHSISIIAHFAEEASIYYVDGGRVSKAGSAKTEVLESLIGDEERVRRQAEFLEEPIVHAMNTYSTQCLLPPAVVTTKIADPQMKQIRDAIYDLPDKKIKILDFGAGKGRLITNLVETASDLSLLKTKVDYVALDSDLGNKSECITQIERLYSDGEKRWFKSTQELLVHHNKGSFNVVVMTNVLHEISPRDWGGLFGEGGAVTELLSDAGFLLLIEDQYIPIGELAHEFGFIVLDTVSLKDLFDISGVDDQIIHGLERDGRLKAHLIPKTYLKRCKPSTVQNSLSAHCVHAKAEIRNYRDAKDVKASRLFAFWIHQYANTKLALDEMYSSD